MFGFLTSRDQGHHRSAGVGEDGVVMAAPVAGARRHRPPAARDARVRRDAPVAQARSTSRACRRSSSSTPRSAPTGASSSSSTSRTSTAGPKLAERIWQAVVRPVAGLHRRATRPRSRRRCAQTQQSALEAAGAAALRAARALLRHRRQAARVPLRALDSRRSGWSSTARYLRAAELGLDRVPDGARRAGPNATQWTVEQEYLYVAADPPAQHRQHVAGGARLGLRRSCAAWSRRLQLDAVPRSTEGFFVDVAGKTGLVRRTGNDSGSMLRYLDTTPLAEQLERAIAALRQAETHRPGAGGVDQPAAHRDPRKGAARRSRRISTPTCAAIRASPARSPRKVRVGLARICARARARRTPATAADDAGARLASRSRSTRSPTRRARRRRVPDEHDSLAASLSSFSDPMWQVKDRSVAGLRIAASGGIGQALALGALVAVRQSDVSEWVLGVVRRLNKVSHRRGRGRRVDHRRPHRAGHAARASASRRTTWASSSTASTCRRWARASTACTCRRRRARTSR